MKINDIVKWWFLESYNDADQQAIVTKRRNRIVYIDTCWGLENNYGYQFTNADIKNGKIKIKKVCNLNDVKECKENDPYNYYREKDIFDLSK